MYFMDTCVDLCVDVCLYQQLPSPDFPRFRAEIGAVLKGH